MENQKESITPLQPPTIKKIFFLKKLWIIIAIIGVVAVMVTLLIVLSVWVLGRNNVKWVEYTDPRGFSVQILETWKVAVDGTGLVRIGLNTDNNQGGIAFVQTLIFIDTKTNEQTLASILPELKNTFPGFEITSQRDIDQYGSLVCQIESTNNEYIGAMLVSTKDKNGLVSGIIAPKNEYNKDSTDLMKVLKSFKYDNSLKDPTNVAGIINMVPWKDPTEGAFTVNVPQGWEIAGGIVRPYLDSWVKVEAISGDKGIRVENMYLPLYTTPNWVLNMSGFKVGSHYPTSKYTQDMIVETEKTAEEYINTILAGKLNLQVKEIINRPDLVEKAAKMPFTTNTTAAEATLIGDGNIHKVIVVEQGMMSSSIGLWGVFVTHYWAPENEIPLVEDVFNNMNSSFKADAAWVKKEQEELSKRIAIIGKTGQEISNMINSTFSNRSSSQDRMSSNFSDAMLGVDRVYNPDTGTEYSVPSGSNNYWSDGYSIIGTQTSDNPIPLGNFIELVPVQ